MSKNAKGAELHVSVLKNEVLEQMNIGEGSVVADLTLGAGGHSEDILKVIGESGKLLGIDRDNTILNKTRKRLAKYSNVDIVCDEFENFCKIAEGKKYSEFDAILLDLGLSSWQIDNNDRGFSYLTDSVLDMRMSNEGQMASDILNEYTEEELNKIFRNYGDVKRSKTFVKKIASFRRAKSFKYVSDLLSVVDDFALYHEQKRNIKGRIWQALRIEVNREYVQLHEVLKCSISMLKEGGRLCVISFHSGEDKIVKNYFVEESKECVCPKEFPKCVCEKKASIKIITKKPIVPKKEEVGTNIRSHSAKLRVAEKI